MVITSRRLLLIYPHWPPSNLVGVMRPRHLANYLPEHGWDVTVLIVDPDCYEEVGDPNLVKTIRPSVDVRMVSALKARKRLRLVGDVALRAASGLIREGQKICRELNPDFILASVPSFYVAPIARILHDRTGIPYGIDYQDPWVRPRHPNQAWLSRHSFSCQLAKILEPWSVRKASLLSGISHAYFAGVIERNPHLSNVKTVEFPVGFDPDDYTIEISDAENAWEDSSRTFIYAGAFLPQSAILHQAMFAAFRRLLDAGNVPHEARLLYYGTGHRPGKSLTDLAREAKIASFVSENRERIPYLHILRLLSRATGVFVIGSTDRHYSASKVYQALLSKRPVFAVLHQESQAVQVLEQCRADQYLVRYNPNDDAAFFSNLESRLRSFLNQTEEWNPNLDALNPYSASASAKRLADAMTDAIADK